MDISSNDIIDLWFKQISLKQWWLKDGEFDALNSQLYTMQQ